MQCGLKSQLAYSQVKVHFLVHPQGHTEYNSKQGNLCSKRCIPELPLRAGLIRAT